MYTNFKWSPTEKKIARAAFDKAYQNEMREIKKELINRIDELTDLNDIWKIHDYLKARRKHIDITYDYRYSVLIRVFGLLLRDSFTTLKDLEGLSEDKIKVIKNISSL